MKIGFLGQQSWSIQTATRFILVDPVLPTWFGTTDRMRFEIWPARRLDLDKMPAPHCVVVTNEHLDHFNLRSLRMLKPGTLMIAGALLPTVCVQAAREAGLEVRLVDDGEDIDLDDVKLSLHHCHEDSAPWERRVYHALAAEKATGLSVLIQSDGLLSASLCEDVTTSRRPPISLFIATNNAQVAPPGSSGTYENLLPLNGPGGNTAVDIFHEVLCRTPSMLGHVPHLAFCGGGYVQVPPKHGPFMFADSEELSQCLGSLGFGQQVHCPAPGDEFTLSSSPQGKISIERASLSWVHDIATAHVPEPPDHDWFGCSIFPESDRAKAHRQVDAELAAMAPTLLISGLGRRMTACHRYLDGPTGSARFAFRFHRASKQHAGSVALDITRCSFDWTTLDYEQIPLTIPFGVDVYLEDFCRLLEGEIQIWELATARMRQWYFGIEPMESPIAFLYSYFSEQVRPDLAKLMYARIAREDQAKR